MESLSEAFLSSMHKEKYDPLLLIPIYILDFLSIHPFNDGNGRMSRLLTLLLLYGSGYIVGKYVNIEMIIEKTKKAIMSHSMKALWVGTKIKVLMRLL